VVKEGGNGEVLQAGWKYIDGGSVVEGSLIKLVNPKGSL